MIWMLTDSLNLCNNSKRTLILRPTIKWATATKMLHQNEPSAGCHWVHAKAEVKPEDVKKHQIEVYEIISRKKTSRP